MSARRIRRKIRSKKRESEETCVSDGTLRGMGSSSRGAGDSRVGLVRKTHPRNKPSHWTENPTGKVVLEDIDSSRVVSLWKLKGMFSNVVSHLIFSLCKYQTISTQNWEQHLGNKTGDNVRTQIHVSDWVPDLQVGLLFWVERRCLLPTSPRPTPPYSGANRQILRPPIPCLRHDTFDSPSVPTLSWSRPTPPSEPVLGLTNGAPGIQIKNGTNRLETRFRVETPTSSRVTRIENTPVPIDGNPRRRGTCG